MSDLDLLVTREQALKKVTARKWMGNDQASWAVFIPGQLDPFVTGLTKREVLYYKIQAAELLRKRELRT